MRIHSNIRRLKINKHRNNCFWYFFRLTYRNVCITFEATPMWNTVYSRETSELSLKLVLEVNKLLMPRICIFYWPRFLFWICFFYLFCRCVHEFFHQQVIRVHRWRNQKSCSRRCLWPPLAFVHTQNLWKGIYVQFY